MGPDRSRDDMSPPRIALIRYRGDIAAVASRRRFYIVTPTLAERSSADPDRRFLMVMCRAFAEYAAGRIPGPFDEALAERFARAVLIDPVVLAAYADDSDAALARRFNVPEDQLALARVELRGG